MFYLYMLWIGALFYQRRCQASISPPDLRLQSIFNPVSLKGAWAVLQLSRQTVTHCRSAYYTSTKRRKRILKANIPSLQYRLSKQNCAWSSCVERVNNTSDMRWIFMYAHVSFRWYSYVLSQVTTHWRNQELHCMFCIFTHKTPFSFVL